MKTLASMISACAVMAASSVSLADCCCQTGSTGTPVVAATPQRYVYRSGYSAVPAPVMTYNRAPGVYSPTHRMTGPESQLAYARARQHIRGW
ncbi:MAG TPA: hypothetical protein VM452_01380 [Caulifigura sp.]|nr:hypothetical protein [Caulifigura sp.]